MQVIKLVCDIYQAEIGTKQKGCFFSLSKRGPSECSLRLDCLELCSLEKNNVTCFGLETGKLMKTYSFLLAGTRAHSS